MIDIVQVWYLLLGVIFIIYIILDGYDFGVGILYPAAKTDDEKRKLLNSIAPLWDGNEVWLVTAGGVLFAAFPEAYSLVFSAFYEAFIIFLIVLILRAVSIEFRGKINSDRWKRLWDKFFIISSYLAPFLLGVVYANILIGIPINADKEYTGGIINLFGPFQLLCGIAGTMVAGCHGAVYAAIKTENDFQKRIGTLFNTFWRSEIIVLLIISIAIIISIPHLTINYINYPIFWLIPLAAFCSFGSVKYYFDKKEYYKAFISSSLLIFFLIMLGGIGSYPYLVISSLENEHSLSIYKAASSADTLYMMLLVIIIGLPFIFVYSYYVHRVFRGKTVLDDSSY